MVTLIANKYIYIFIMIYENGMTLVKVFKKRKLGSTTIYIFALKYISFGDQCLFQLLEFS